MKNKRDKIYLNKKGQFHRLKGPAYKYHNGDRGYYINNIWYAYFNLKLNNLFILTFSLNLIKKYECYMKKNFQKIIAKHNPKIDLDIDIITKEDANKLPNWIKDLIIL